MRRSLFHPFPENMNRIKVIGFKNTVALIVLSLIALHGAFSQEQNNRRESNSKKPPLIVQDQIMYYIENPRQWYKKLNTMMFLDPFLFSEINQAPRKDQLSEVSKRLLQYNPDVKYSRLRIGSFTSNLAYSDYTRRNFSPTINILGMGEIKPLDLNVIFPKVIIDW